MATNLNNLAELLQAVNRLGEAQPFFRRALTILETNRGADHPYTVSVRKRLAALVAALAKGTEMGRGVAR